MSGGRVRLSRMSLSYSPSAVRSTHDLDSSSGAALLPARDGVAGKLVRFAPS
jgi:hypothetical protein